LQHTAGELLDRELGALIGDRLDERETAGPPALPVERHTDTLDLDPFAEERLFELLLGDVVRKVADEKAGSHWAASCFPLFLPFPPL